MTRRSLRLHRQHSPGWWAVGFELYRHPRMFSRGTGPEWGFYAHLGSWRFSGDYTQRYTRADLDRLRSLTLRQERQQ